MGSLKVYLAIRSRFRTERPFLLPKGTSLRAGSLQSLFVLLESRSQLPVIRGIYFVYGTYPDADDEFCSGISW